MILITEDYICLLNFPVGNYTVASELLKCGYRSLEAKNEEGQTAVHLASRLGKNDILAKLINSGIASNCLEKLVNCRDTDGYTPLHVSINSLVVCFSWFCVFIKKK